MKVVAIVQARMGSTRLPNKVMMPLGEQPMIGVLFTRLSKALEVDQLVLATSTNEENAPLISYVQGLGYTVVSGSEQDVLDRYLFAARKTEADAVVRITGDCPLVDAKLVDEVVLAFKESGADYVSNISPATYPDGLDVEVFSTDALEKSAEETSNAYNREHVTAYLRDSGRFTKHAVTNGQDLSALRWTVDEDSDYEVISGIFSHFAPGVVFPWESVLELQQKQPELFTANQALVRNEGATMGAGQKLWRRAKSTISGGNMLLSKRPEMFLPEHWPAYFEKARGCQLWDLDGNSYTDMSIMGVGTNILGYGHPEVDAAVHEVVSAGNMSTLNCPEEVYLAEKLVEIHPWSEMVRFARTGGEANAIAIRIARAASGRDNVAICGYHGWHDWYLSANLADDRGLDGHLIPGLEPNGVPRCLQNTVFPFNYNNFEELQALVQAHNIGVIKMEVMRNKEPENDFLQKVRRLATESGIVLIFDECTSGFRQTFGGLHKLHGVEPDMAIFGKALGNGYAITATIGRRDVMEAAQSTFISSTFWTERIGPSAALKTLEIMERTKSWDVITRIGSDIRERWLKLAGKYELELDIWGLPALSGFTFKSSNALAYKTLITQEMLSHSVLASNCVYVSIEHKPDIVDRYFSLLDPILETIKECENGRDVNELLHGPICHDGFRRLN